MADQYFAASEAIALAAATPLVTLVVYPTASTRRMAVNEIAVTFNGTTATATPAIVRLVRTTTAPTGSPTACTQGPTPMDASSPASLCTGFMPTWTTGPTVTSILRTWYVSPTSGIVLQLPLGLEADSPSTASNGFGIQVVAPAVVSATSYLSWVE